MKILGILAVTIAGVLVVLLAPHASATTPRYLHCVKNDVIAGFPFDDNTLVNIGIEANHAVGGVQRPDLDSAEIATLMQKYNLNIYQASAIVDCANDSADGTTPDGV
jgi:hypothetical protein